MCAGEVAQPAGHEGGDITGRSDVEPEKMTSRRCKDDLIDQRSEPEAKKLDRTLARRRGTSPNP